MQTGVSDDEKDVALNKSHVFIVVASQPGCMPDSLCAYPMDAHHADIREEILSLMGSVDFDDNEIDWDAIQEMADTLNLSGDCIGAPDGRVIEVYSRSCAEVLADNWVDA